MLTVVVVSNLHTVTFEIIRDFSRFYVYQGQIIISIIQLVVIILVKNIRAKISHTISTKTLLALCLLPIMIFLFYLHIILNPVDTHMFTITEIFAVIGVILINVFLLILIENSTKRNEQNRILVLSEAQNTAQQAHIQQLLRSHHQIRKISHDFKHHVNILYALAKENRTEELLQSLTKLHNAYDGAFIVETGNIMFDAVLSAKAEEAKQQGIEFTLKLDVAPNAPYLSNDLCVLLSNGLDNAIEACKHEKDTIKSIELETISTPARFMCRMRNTFGITPQPSGGFLKTTKKDKLHHGIGLKSMKQTAQDLGGDLAYEYDSQYFMVHLSIPTKLS